MALALGLAPATLGCASSPGGRPAAPHIEGTVTPVAVPDASFGQSVHQLLRDGSFTPARLGLLVGVVRRQMAHAGERFARGNEEHGTDSVLGALTLVRRGEGRAEMIDPAGERALAGAVARVSQRGDEGRAQALMRMRAAALAAGTRERADVDEHIAVLDRWMKETRTGGPMQRLYAEQRATIARAIVDATEPSHAAAVNAVAGWIDRAIEYNIQFRQTGERPEREEAVEASRALETGGATMAALYLRHGDAKGALDEIERSGARRIIKPSFFERLRAAAAEDGPREWQALTATLVHRDYREADDNFDLDPELFEAALWGAALESYRRDATHLGSAVVVARMLTSFGMSEAAPLVLADAVGPKPNVEAVTTAMSLFMGALAEDDRADDLASARRTYASGAALLAAVERPDLKGKVEPSAARARFVMASLEVRAGDLAAARPLLQAAVAAEPRVSGYTSLALLERQAGAANAALAQIERALAAPDARLEPLEVAEAAIVSYEIHREASRAAEAQAALDLALQSVLSARQLRGNAAQKARAERLLGRVLDGYGDAKGAVRALERAMQLAADDRPVLGATVLDAVGRALVRRDVGSARAALKRGLDGEVDEEDLVYAGLWLLLLERDLKVPTDGTAERALRAGAGRASWTGKLAAWGSGKLSDAELVTMAQSTAQRVEADFYTALARKVAGDPGAEARLRDVAKSPVIDLLEVRLAREIVAPRVATELPRNAAVP